MPMFNSTGGSDITVLLGLLKRFCGALCSVNLFEMEGDGVNYLLVAVDREEP